MAKATDKIRVALIGAGSMANGVHYPSLAEFDDVELVGLCDLDEEKLAATAKEFGIPKTYTSYQAMLDETKPQAVYVLMPPHHLFDVCMEVLLRGHDLFVEKPPGITSHQTACMAKAATDGGLITGVGFQRRYVPAFLRGRNEVLKHGPVHQVVAAFYKDMEVTDVHPYYRGAIDVLTCDAIHMVDSLRYYAGGEVRDVRSVIGKVDAWFATSFNALVTFDNGVTGVLLVNWRTGTRKLTLELHATDASAYMNADGMSEVYADNDEEPRSRFSFTEAAGSEERYIHQGFRDQSRAFIDAAQSRTPPHNDMTDAVKTMELVDAVYAAAGTVPKAGGKEGGAK